MATKNTLKLTMKKKKKKNKRVTKNEFLKNYSHFHLFLKRKEKVIKFYYYIFLSSPPFP